MLASATSARLGLRLNLNPFIRLAKRPPRKPTAAKHEARKGENRAGKPEGRNKPSKPVPGVQADKPEKENATAAAFETVRRRTRR